MKNYQVESGRGKHKVYLFATVTAGGILANLTGGEEPHLGAVVLSVPRPSLETPGVISCTTSSLPLLGHKDDEAASPVAEMLAIKTELPVSVAAGIHVRGATGEDIEIIKNNCIDCGRKLISLIEGQFPGNKKDRH